MAASPQKVTGVKFSGHVMSHLFRCHTRTHGRICRAPLSYQTEFGSGATTVAPYRDFAVPCSAAATCCAGCHVRVAGDPGKGALPGAYFVEEPISPEEFYGALGNQRW